MGNYLFNSGTSLLSSLDTWVIERDVRDPINQILYTTLYNSYYPQKWRYISMKLTNAKSKLEIKSKKLTLNA